MLRKVRSREVATLIGLVIVAASFLQAFAKSRSLTKLHHHHQGPDNIEKLSYSSFGWRRSHELPSSSSENSQSKVTSSLKENQQDTSNGKSTTSIGISKQRASRLEEPTSAFVWSRPHPRAAFSAPINFIKIARRRADQPLAGAIASAQPAELSKLGQPSQTRESIATTTTITTTPTTLDLDLGLNLNLDLNSNHLHRRPLLEFNDNDLDHYIHRDQMKIEAQFRELKNKIRALSIEDGDDGAGGRAGDDDKTSKVEYEINDELNKIELQKISPLNNNINNNNDLNSYQDSIKQEQQYNIVTSGPSEHSYSKIIQSNPNVIHMNHHLARIRTTGHEEPLNHFEGNFLNSFMVACLAGMGVTGTLIVIVNSKMNTLRRHLSKNCNFTLPPK